MVREWLQSRSGSAGRQYNPRGGENMKIAITYCVA